MNSGRIDLAMEEHFKAATAYMAAIERSHDESVWFSSFTFLQSINSNNSYFLGKTYTANATWRTDKGRTGPPTKSRETERRG